MTKVKEITEEKFLVLAELGMPVAWDKEPFYSSEQIKHILTRDTSSGKSGSRFILSSELSSEYLKNKEAVGFSSKEHKFYTLVEDSAERSEDE